MLIHRLQFQEIFLSDHKHSKQIDELFSTLQDPESSWPVILFFLLTAVSSNTIGYQYVLNEEIAVMRYNLSRYVQEVRRGNLKAGKTGRY